MTSISEDKNIFSTISVSMSFRHRFRCRFNIGFDVVSTSVSTSFRHRFRRRSTVKKTVYLRLIRRRADVGSSSIVLVIEDVTTLYRPHFSVGMLISYVTVLKNNALSSQNSFRKIHWNDMI